MASPCASAPWSSRYAIASAVTAGWRGMNASTSRCARALDHVAIAFQISTSVGRSVMTAHTLVAARRITRQRRCPPREDVPPAVPRRRRLAEDVRVFVTLDALVRRAQPGGELVDEREARRPRLAQLDDPGVRLADVREGLPLPERDVEEPFAAARLPEPHGATLAVVEDVRRLVDHEVLEAAVRAKVFPRHPARGLLADADEVRGIRAE